MNIILEELTWLQSIKIGEVEIIRGESSRFPQPPVLADDAMEIAQIQLPPYLYNPVSEPKILLRDNRRFTMRDIGKLEDRIENLEDLTSLTMLELNAKTIEVTDANGLDRFKTGFVVSDFRDKSIMDQDSLHSIFLKQRQLQLLQLISGR